MISAAWTQIAALELQAPSTTTGPAATVEPPPSLRVMVGSQAIIVGEGEGAARFSSGDWRGVERELARLHDEHDRGEAGLEILVEDGVRYDDIAHVVDAGAAAGIHSIQIAASRGAGGER